MGKWRLLSDHYMQNGMIAAGEVVEMPADWRPSNAVEPLDAEAVDAFYAAGPQVVPLVSERWNVVTQPTTYWRQLPGGRQWALTGLGALLPPVSI
jgi:hypothetical protein